MTPQALERLKSALHAALNEPLERRATLLEESLSDSPVLLATARDLLVHADSTSTFLAQPYLESTSRTSDPVLPGRVIGPYRIDRQIGRGGMSTVYMASRADQLFSKQVAIKVLDHTGENSGSPDDPSSEHFLKEVRILAEVDHPSIVRLIDGGISEDGLRYLVMEYVEGKPLDEYCRIEGLTTRRRIELLIQIAEAVSGAHHHLVLHRDLKPKNVLVTPSGKIKLLDFGVSKILGQESSATPTRTGFWRMTLEYASPEQAQGRRSLNFAADVYSLGVVLYEIITGASPYGEACRSPHELVRAVAEANIIPPRSVAPSLSADLEAVILKALRREPESRYRTAEAFSADLRRYLDGLPVEAYRGRFAYRMMKFVIRRWPLLLAGACLVSLAAWWGLKTWHEQQLLARLVHGTLRGIPEGAVLAEQRRFLTLYCDREPRYKPALQQLVGVLMRIALEQGYPSLPSLANTAEAYRTASQAWVALERLESLEPGDKYLAYRKSELLCLQGTLLIELDRYPEAEQRFRSAVAQDSLDDAAIEAAGVADVDRLNALAESLASLSRIALHRRDEAECVSLRRRSVAIRRKLVTLRPHPRHRLTLAGSLALLGWALRDFGRPEEALAVYQESTGIVQELVHYDETNLETRLMRARNLEQVGRCWLALDKRAQARTHLAAAVADFRKVIAEESASASVWRWFALCLGAYAESLPPREARPAADEAIRLAARFEALDPANLKARGEFDEMRARLSALR